MLTSDSLTDKTIVLAEHDEASAKQIRSALEGHGFTRIRCVSDGKKVYEILKAFYEHSDNLGLIIVNETLPHCQLPALQQSLCCSAGSAAIPFIVLSQYREGLPLEDEPPRQSFKDTWLLHRLTVPVNQQELLMATEFLLKLRQERLNHSAQQERMILELSARSLNDAKLKYLAAHDELTGLFNRSNFERQLKLLLNRTREQQRDAALLFLEVDRFCLINEWKGFDVGDRLLVELANLMRKLAPAKSVFARVGLNEFCLFVQDMSKNQVKRYAAHLKAVIETHRFVFDEASHNITVSLGIAGLDESVSTRHPGKLLLQARQACQFGKLTGQNKIGTYDAQEHAVQVRQSDIYWAPIIERALQKNQLFLVFQPVVELANGAISHYEVLVRMRSEDKVIQPNVFIPVAERMGLIEAIDLWVLENTINFLAALPPHRSYVSVAIKLSAGAFQYPDLTGIIQDKLELAWVAASRLIFEIAESAVVNNFAGTLQVVNGLRALGCKVALKNCGGGFYVLDSVRSFPADYIKIDDQLIKHWVNEENDQTILKSMVDMITKLGKKTIFVYVESSSTVLKLRECGATLAQGYTLGRPECELLEGPSIPFSQYMSERHRAEKALSEKESYLRVLLDNIPFLVWFKDTQSRFLAVNRKFAQQLGVGNAEAVIGKTDFDFYPPEKAEQYQHQDQSVLALRQRKAFEQHWSDRSGMQRWSEIFVVPVLDKHGEALGTLGLARDISERKSIEADLRIAATAFESREAMVVTDADTLILKINHAFSRITGYTAEETLGRKMNLLKTELQDAAFYADMWEKIQQTGNWHGEIRNRRKDGEIYPAWLSITAVKADDGRVTHYVGTMIDITARKAMEEQMHHIAYHDVLTDLPNRILLADRLQQTLAQARRENTKLALMYIDLDKFKPVNDNFGHDVGDLLLKEVALRLQQCMKRETDTVSRLGGDEFVVLLTNYDKDTDVASVAENILTALSQPFFIEQRLINISSSIGIATYPAHGTDAQTLMKNADTAMYQAKRAGRSCLKFYVYQADNEDELI